MVLKKIIFILGIVIILNALVISPIYAMGNIITSGKEFLKKGEITEEKIAINALEDTSDFIFNMFFVVAVVLAVGVGTVLGIKFITSSVEGQAKIKESVVPFVVGCIVIFAAFPIWSFVVDAGQNATGTDTVAEDTISITCSQCGETISRTKQEIIEVLGEDGTRYRLHCPNCDQPTIATRNDGEYNMQEVELPKCPDCGEILKINSWENINQIGETLTVNCDNTKCSRYKKEKNGKFIAATKDRKTITIKRTSATKIEMICDELVGNNCEKCQENYYFVKKDLSGDYFYTKCPNCSQLKVIDIDDNYNAYRVTIPKCQYCKADLIKDTQTLVDVYNFKDDGYIPVECCDKSHYLRADNFYTFSVVTVTEIIIL